MVGPSSPSGFAYQTALQNPKLCLRDPTLRNGTMVLGSDGLPRASSGNFASVFSMRSSDGKCYAVKCFTRHVPDHRERYGIIARKLAELRLPWTVGFEFLEQEILVEGRRYPILKMEWVDGKELVPYVKAHLRTPSVIAGVAHRFADMATGLAESGIAHGDLQHGNILVLRDGDLRLVDYDGMYVPSLERLGGTERGHRNYQSPKRTKVDFGPDLDRFSAWVIYAALVALTLDPVLCDGLWTERDESLLLREGDFADPQSSRTLRALRNSGNQALADLANFVDRVARADLASVPPFSPDLMPRPDGTRRTIRSPYRTHGPVTPVPSGLPDWMRPDVPAKPTPPVTPSPPPRPTPGVTPTPPPGPTPAVTTVPEWMFLSVLLGVLTFLFLRSGRPGLWFDALGVVAAVLTYLAARQYRVWTKAPLGAVLAVGGMVFGGLGALAAVLLALMSWMAAAGPISIDNQLDEQVAGVVLTVQPRNVTALVARGEYRRRMGHIDQALADLDRALQLEPDHPFALALRADLYRERRQFDDALDDVNRVLELELNDGFARIVRARIARDQGRLADAVTDLNLALDALPEYAAAMDGHVRIYRDPGSDPEALADLRRALELEPTLVYRLATDLADRLSSGRTCIGERAADQPLELDPDNVVALKIRAEIERRCGSGEDALANLNRALELRSAYPDALFERANLYVFDAAGQDRYEDAVTDLDRALELEPDYAAALAVRGSARRLLDKYEEALADLNRALELSPDYPFAFAERGEIYRLLGRSEEALADLNRALELSPDYHFALVVRGTTYLLSERYEEALADLNRALELSPDDDYALNQRGTVNLELGHDVEALADADRALALRPGYIDAMVTRARALHALGRPEDALAALNQALESDPDYGPALELRQVITG